MQTVSEGLQRRPPQAPLAAVGALGVVVLHVNIQVGLDFVKGVVDLFPECCPVELVLNRLMKPLTDTVGLRMLRLGPGMSYLVEAQEQLIGMRVFASTELRSPICQHAQNFHTVLLEERQHPVIQRIGGGDRNLGVVDLGEGHRAVGVDYRLLIDAPNSFEIANILADKYHNLPTWPIDMKTVYAVATSVALPIVIAIISELIKE